MKKNPLSILTGNSNPQLAMEIAKNIGQPLAGLKVGAFSDGEIRVKIVDNVRGHDVFIIQSTSPPVNQSIMELLIILDALKRASPNRITAVIPYYGYARQDRKDQPRVPITSKLIANLLTTAGAIRILSMDLHADQIQGFFDIPVDHLYAAPIMFQYLKENGFGPKTVVVSPDAGGVERARWMANKLGCSIAIIDKRRPHANKAEIHHIIGEVKGKKAVIIDDMVDTAGTLCEVAKALKAEGAEAVYSIATHGVLSGSAIDRIEASSLKSLTVTNTIPEGERKRSSKIKTLSVAELLAQAILRIHREESISSLFL